MTAWRSVAGISVLVLLSAAVATGCTKKAEVDAGANRDRVIEAGDTYVALGDSYTSAPALGTASWAPGCLQTTGNYPHLLAAAMDLELVDVSCGGAKTINMTRSQSIGGDVLPPQLDAITEDTALVTLSIGANNGAVYGTLMVTCARLASADRSGAPCSDLAQQNPEVLPEVFDGVRKDIVKTVGRILDKAPKARVVVVGYPQIIPAEGTCADLPLGEGDYPFGRGVVEQFVEAQEQAAKEAKAEYIDVWSATEGHDICGEDPWVAGVTPRRAATPYHPYAEEQQAVADLLESTLSGS